MQTDHHQFSAREKETIDLLLQGKSNKQIALALGVSVSTIEFHLKNVYRKLQVKSRTEAMVRLGESIGKDTSSNQGQSIGGVADKQRESVVDKNSAGTENDVNTNSTRRIPMKKQFYIFIGSSLLAVALVAVGILSTKLSAIKRYLLPQNTLEVSVTANGEMSDLGTSFILSPSLGYGTQNEIVPQSDEFNLWPEHTRLTLTGYPLEGTAFEPRIEAYPASAFAEMSDCAKATISWLKDIVAGQHAAPAMPDTCPPATESLPFLPEAHAKQILHAQEKSLTFKNGAGIRYITQYGQAAFPAINNMDIIYTFQGITSDGKYYVSVTLPVHLPYLAADYGPESFKNPADWQNPEKFPGYLKTMTDQLNQTDNPFSPSLETLDALIQSLFITGYR